MKINQFIIIISLILSHLSCDSAQNQKADMSVEPTIETKRIQPKTKLDILLVFHQSMQMKEELKRLSQGFQAVTQSLIDSKVDFRITAVSDQVEAGILQAAFLNPQNMHFDPNADIDVDICQKLPQIISSEVLYALSQEELIAILKEGDSNCPRDDQACELAFYQKRYVDQTIACYTAIQLDSTQALMLDRSLESMRKALACEGSNEEIIDTCCIGRGVNRKFNPSCTQNMPFLRTDATLVVLPLSDQNDCSHPADFPAQSEKLLCHPNGLIDENQDGILDIYAEAYAQRAGDIYTQHCGKYSTALECQNALCHFEISLPIECHWNSDKITEVDEFKRFLLSLKQRADQVIFAPLVGFRAYDQQKNPLSYQKTEQEPSMECLNQRNIDQCCIDGVCANISFEFKACDIPNKKVSAYPGTRYLELAQALSLSTDNQITCDKGQEPVYQELSEQYYEQAGKQCLNACTDDYTKALEKVLNQIEWQKNRYCFDHEPISLQQPCTACEADMSNQMLDMDKWTLTVQADQQLCPYEILIRDDQLDIIDIRYELPSMN